MNAIVFRRGALDRMLAAGADPQTDPKLARRARQLSSCRFRDGLATGLRRLVEAAEEPVRGRSSAVPLQRREILADRELILELANDLSSADELSPRGIALIERLITDGASALYGPGLDEDLHTALCHARAALYLG